MRLVTAGGTYGLPFRDLRGGVQRGTSEGSRPCFGARHPGDRAPGTGERPSDTAETGERPPSTRGVRRTAAPHWEGPPETRGVRPPGPLGTGAPHPRSGRPDPVVPGPCGPGEGPPDTLGPGPAAVRPGIPAGSRPQSRARIPGGCTCAQALGHTRVRRVARRPGAHGPPHALMACRTPAARLAARTALPAAGGPRPRSHTRPTAPRDTERGCPGPLNGPGQPLLRAQALRALTLPSSGSVAPPAACSIGGTSGSADFSSPRNENFFSSPSPSVSTTTM